jgi:dTDP-4-dehydrorhamnose reductase
MNESSILIIGASGQLGMALKEKYPAAQAVDSTELDITDARAVETYDWSKVTVVLNAAAYTNVDGAESLEGRIAAWKVNAIGARNLAEVATQHSLTLVHISSDYVFDGTQENHTEEEAFSPLGVYGQSKAAGDIAVSLVPKHYILRATWVIGEGKNFVRTMINLGQRSISPAVVNDQVGRLTFTSELVRSIEHLLTNGAGYGSYNTSNGGASASWADITREIFSLAGFNELTVTDTTTAAYFADKPDASPRPLKSTLDLSKLEKTGFTPRDWHDDLSDYVKKEISEGVAS